MINKPIISGSSNIFANTDPKVGPLNTQVRTSVSRRNRLAISKSNGKLNHSEAPVACKGSVRRPLVLPELCHRLPPDTPYRDLIATSSHSPAATMISNGRVVAAGRLNRRWLHKPGILKILSSEALVSASI